jgi:Sucrase/ferredoxin-like
MASRPFCSEEARAAGESLAATASRIDYWLLVEYRGRWERDVLTGSLLSPELKAHLRTQLDRLGRSRLLFVKRPERRGPRRRLFYMGCSIPGEERLHALEFEEHDDLLGFDFVAALTGGEIPGVPVGHPLYVVCTHGVRDRCCARYGRPLYDAVREVEPGWTWQSTHVGGDRFAGNLVILPEGLYYGWVGRDDVEPILREHGRGRVRLDRYRGRSVYPFPVQAAERAVRGKGRTRGIADLEYLGAVREGPGSRITFRDLRAGKLHEVDVVAGYDDEARFLTCSSAEAKRPIHCRVVAHAVRDV